MSSLTGNYTHSVPNPDYVDNETTPNTAPTIQEGWTMFLWLVEVAAETPRVYSILVEEGVIAPTEVEPGVYRVIGEYASSASDRPGESALTIQNGSAGYLQDTYPDATYDAEGSVIELGTPVQVFSPIVDPGGSGPVVTILEDSPDEVDFWSVFGPYTPPAEETTI